MTTLNVQKRDLANKAKKLRREGWVTGILFGHQIEGSVPIQIEKKEAERIFHECNKGSQLDVVLEGRTYDVLLKEIDYNSMNHTILEMDFQALVAGEKVHSTAEIVLHNQDKVPGGVVEHLLNELSYKATPDKLVDKIIVDCAGLKVGDVLKVADLDIVKAGQIDVITHLDTPVISVAAPHNAEAAEDTAEAEPAK